MKLKIEIEIDEEAAALLFANYWGKKTVEEIVTALAVESAESYRRAFAFDVEASVEAFRVASHGR